MNEDNYALVIDDSRSMREYVSLILQQGAQIDHVIEAENPDHALELIDQQCGQAVLIVSDINMPGMPIEEFISDVKARPEFDETVLLLLTGSCQETAESLAEEFSVDGVLAKPFDTEALLALVYKEANIHDRRHASRVAPLTKCAVDLGFDNNHPAFSAEVINISESGILLSAPLPQLGAGYVYDFTSLTLQPDNDEPIEVYAQIVRVEADRQSVHKDDPMVKIALEFGRLKKETLSRICRYVVLNDNDTNLPRQ